VAPASSPDREGFAGRAARSARADGADRTARRSNASQIVLGDITVQMANAGPPGPMPDSPLAVPHWFNPNLTFIWFTVPGLIGTLCLLISLVVTGQSVARERELGTFDQLMVSPLRTSEILAGKLVPPLISAWRRRRLSCWWRCSSSTCRCAVRWRCFISASSSFSPRR
jgi:ABC-type multidrug transport system permease subunit